MLPRNSRLHQPEPLDSTQSDASRQAVSEASAVDRAYREALARFKATLPLPLGGPARRPTIKPRPVLRSNVYPECTNLGLCRGCGFMLPVSDIDDPWCGRCEARRLP
jgi:hypothetical protein